LSTAGNPNKDIALAFLRTLETETNVAAMRYATEDFTWWHPLIGDIGREGMITFDESIKEMFAGQGKMTIHNIIGERELVAVEAEIALPMKSGETYCNQYHFLFFMHEGKIRRLKEYNNTAYAAKMLKMPTTSH
jgi:ketosteroid isomerase-like protein